MQVGAAEMLPPRAKTPGKLPKRPNSSTAGPVKPTGAGQPEAAPSAPLSAPGHLLPVMLVDTAS